ALDAAGRSGAALELRLELALRRRGQREIVGPDAELRERRARDSHRELRNDLFSEDVERARPVGHRGIEDEASARAVARRLLEGRHPRTEHGSLRLDLEASQAGADVLDADALRIELRAD